MSGYTLVVPEHVGKTIARLRAARGLSQTRLGELSGVASDTISRIERGERDPQPSTLKSIMGALKAEGSIASPRQPKEAERESGDSAAGSEIGVEDRLGELLFYIGTLKGKRRSEFIRAVIALLAAIEHARPATGSGTSQNDGR